MRKTIFPIIFLLTLFWMKPAFASGPDISGNSAVLIDAVSGQVLVDLGKDEKLPPASTTKVLTAILAIESGRMEESVTIGPNPTLVDGTKVYLEEGETAKLKDLVAAAMIHSANDAALAIAEFLSGSQEEFAKLMNKKAKELGAYNSNFVTPHGLSTDGHYTTAYDLSIISRYAMQNETFRKLAASKILDWQGKAWQTRLININKMLWNYDGATGVKTGYTTEAKSTIIAAAERNEQSFIAVVLGAPGSAVWDDASKLLDYGFKNFKQLKLANPEEVVATLELNSDTKLKLVPIQEFSLSLPINSSSKVESHLHLQQIQGAVTKGQVIGEQTFTIDGIETGKVQLIAANPVKPSFKLSNLFLYTGAGLFFIQVLWRGTRSMKRRKRRNSRYRYDSNYRVN